MTLIRAIDYRRLAPLRNPRNEGAAGNSLLDHHRANHPNEIRIQPEIPLDKLLGGPIHHLFFGVQVFPAQDLVARSNSFDAYGLDMTRSEIAALLLEQTFDQVSWDQANDRTVARTSDGRLFSNQGTNLLEAGVLLPLLKNLAEEHGPKVKKEIGWVEAVFQPAEVHQAQSASPLQIMISVPGLGDPERFTRWSYERTVTESFLQAVKPFLSA